MTFAASKLRRGEIVAALGATLLLVSMLFLTWYDAGAHPSGAGAHPSGAGALDGWQAHSVLRWLMLLTILAAFALVVLTATQRTPAVPVTIAVVVTGLAVLLLLLLALRVLLDQPGAYGIGDVRVGAWLGLAGSAGIVRGAYLSMRDERTEPVAPPAPAPPAPAQPS